MKLDLKELISALDETTKRHIENAAQRCVARSGNEILIEDVLYVMCESKNSLLNALLDQYKIDSNDMINALQHGTKVNATESTSPVFSTLLVDWLESSYVLAKVKLNLMQITDSSLLMSIFENSIKYANTRYFKLLCEIPFEEAKLLLDGLNKEAVEKGEIQSIQDDNKKVKTSAELDKFTVDLTKMAQNDEIDPVLCRDNEIKQAIDILLRRRKNNPIIVGEAGVGKTAVIEGLAIKIIKKEVPKQLFNAKILSLDIGTLQAGAGVKGEFERRLKAVINEIRNSPDFIILFIDEAHTLIGAGGNEGSQDAANLLKPELARGGLRTIAATTWLEYRKYFEKDAALSRRFQKIDLLEPSIEESVTILRGLAKKYEDAHGVYIEDDALKAASSLSARYITGRQLPDKAIDVLDTACANVKISRTNMPYSLQVLNTSIEDVQRTKKFYTRDNELGIKNYTTKIKELDEKIASLENDAIKIKKSWEEQRDTISKIDEAIKENDKDKILEFQEEINILQENDKYIHRNVTKDQVAEVISSWTGIPLGSMIDEQIKDLMNLEEKMKERVIGQDDAISNINRFLEISTAGLKKENTPTGVFLLVGPSGVGKTETAVSIAQLNYGGEKFLTTINMTEFQEKHTVSRLIGSPPGYVGYGDGGQLTDPVRVKPYSVVLLDEIEKAHPDVLNLFYQLFDKGVLNDGEGREIDFKNTIIIMTSNLATAEITELCTKYNNITSLQIKEEIMPTLSKSIPAALLGRMNVIPYLNLNDDNLKKITKLKFNFINEKLAKKEIEFEYSDDLLNHIVLLSNARDTGARNIESIINSKVMPQISRFILDAAITKEKIKKIIIDIDDNNQIYIRSEKC